MILKKIGVWSAAKIAGIVYATIGLIAGAVIALISSMGAGLAAMQSSDAPTWLGPVLGAGAVVLLPVIYGVMGLLTGAISAALYNFFSGLVGGLQLEIQPTSST